MDNRGAVLAVSFVLASLLGRGGCNLFELCLSSHQIITVAVKKTKHLESFVTHVNKLARRQGWLAAVTSLLSDDSGASAAVWAEERG